MLNPHLRKFKNKTQKKPLFADGNGSVYRRHDDPSSAARAVRRGAKRRGGVSRWTWQQHSVSIPVSPDMARDVIRRQQTTAYESDWLLGKPVGYRRQL